MRAGRALTGAAQRLIRHTRGKPLLSAQSADSRIMVSGAPAADGTFTAKIASQVETQFSAKADAVDFLTAYKWCDKIIVT